MISHLCLSQEPVVEQSIPVNMNWKYSLPNDEIILNYHIYGNICILSSINAIYAIDASNGIELWRFSFNTMRLNSICDFSESYGFFTSYKSGKPGESSLIILDLSTGKSIKTMTSSELVYRPPVYFRDGNLIYLTSTTKKWKNIYDDNSYKTTHLNFYSLQSNTLTRSLQVKDKNAFLIKAIDNYIVLSENYRTNPQTGNVSNNLVFYDSNDGKLLGKYKSTFVMSKALLNDIQKVKNSQDQYIIFSEHFYELANLSKWKKAWQKFGPTQNVYQINDTIITFSFAQADDYYSVGWNAFTKEKGKKCFVKQVYYYQDIGKSIGKAWANIAGNILGSVPFVQLFSSAYKEKMEYLNFIPIPNMLNGLFTTNFIEGNNLICSYQNQKNNNCFLSVLNTNTEDASKKDILISGITEQPFLLSKIAKNTVISSANGKLLITDVITEDTKTVYQPEINQETMGLIEANDWLFLFHMNGVACFTMK